MHFGAPVVPKDEWSKEAIVGQRKWSTYHWNRESRAHGQKEAAQMQALGHHREPGMLKDVYCSKLRGNGNICRELSRLRQVRGYDDFASSDSAGKQNGELQTFGDKFGSHHRYLGYQIDSFSGIEDLSFGCFLNLTTAPISGAVLEYIPPILAVANMRTMAVIEFTEITAGVEM
ncbi:hypothetical protein H0H87_007096 [Tephrocybe sp. NHM501043]|nr:hypothetical protein H0H87_007096 [Tephrocybe sp. NHM501043]